MLAFVYFEDNPFRGQPGRRSAAKLLEARIATNVAKLPELLGAYDASAASPADK